MRVLVLAGGFDQIALIDEFKSRGHYVILADYYEHPMAELAADKHCQVSTLDLEKIEKLAIDEKVDLITTACTDQALLTVAYVSERLGLPCYLSYETARNVTNKEYMKSKFVEFDVPTARHIIVDSCDGIDGLIKNLRYPLIVKPVDCNSSKGVVKTTSYAELLPSLKNAIGFSRTGSAVIEEFIQGDEYTVDFWIDHGEPRMLMASEITKFKGVNTFTINGCRTLPELEERKVAMLNDIAKKISVAFELDNMPMFMQVIDSGEEIFVLEFSARMGGGTKYRMIDIYSGVPIMKTYVDRVLGDIPQIPEDLTKKHMLLSFIYCTKGTLASVDGVEDLISEGVVDEYYQYKTAGTYFDKAENSGDRVAGVLLTGDGNEVIEQKRCDALQRIRVINEAGQNMILIK